MSLSLALALAASLSPQESEHPWPPVGPTWATDPQVAFERARAEPKGVFVYVATGG